MTRFFGTCAKKWLIYSYSVPVDTCVCYRFVVNKNMDFFMLILPWGLYVMNEGSVASV
jgi:hypothetical protein